MNRCAVAAGAKMKSRGQKEKRIKTILGDIEIRRSIFVCPGCGASRIPADEMLGVVRTGFFTRDQKDDGSGWTT